MPAVRLPAETYFVSVDTPVLRGAMERIEEHFRDLLENGAQAAGLPEGCYAAGQYLIPHSINQRGLYGTSAAVLALARSARSPDRIRLIEGILRYIADRRSIEISLAQSGEEMSALTTRLAQEWRTAFKCADLLYALSAAPAVVNGREHLLNKVLARIQQARSATGGWAADLDSCGEVDPLATASIVRGLSAAGAPVDDTDLELVRRYAHDERNGSIYVRVFCLFALLETGDRGEELYALWKELLEKLTPRLRDRAEANYEFTLGNHYHYVRVPWQLYLLSCTSLLSPLRIVFNRHIRTVLLDSIAAVNSAEGYVYASSGHMRSTRTYSILMDTLWGLEHTLAASRYLASVSALANLSVRIVYSRTTTWLVLLVAAAVGGLSLWSWIFAQKFALSAVGPELFSTGMLAAVGLMLRRLRRR
ncbi:hypothetical protein NE236_00180 [Actinoallomurus purpureus]|uniref:hypothetical protein n=1 Tax=Actinoallomurus purpureus TaxID=478114 RepID=UPI0020932B64|nr:hypothetical protein [Actinoallomurus purpureus]MCO6003394.1 hypothetical protein [Actinoallomurus purpureus]